MNRVLSRILLLLLGIGVFSAVASADEIPVGVFSYDATGTADQFDILNLTGANALPPDFPITTALTFTVTSVVVDFTTGPAETLTAANFTSDGFGGFTGNDDFTADSITSATLTGTLSPTTGLSGLPAGDTGIDPTFTAVITPSSGNTLVAGTDLTVIDATGVSGSTGGGGGSTVPEPGTWLLTGIGLVGLGLLSTFMGRRQLCDDSAKA